MPPIPTYPVFDTYKACCPTDDPVIKSPYDVEAVMVVSLSKDPPKITVEEELVSPFAKDRAVWNEEVSATTPDDEIDISPDTVAKYGEEEALPISICPAMGLDTSPTTPVPFPNKRLFAVKAVLPVPPKGTVTAAAFHDPEVTIPVESMINPPRLADPTTVKA